MYLKHRINSEDREYYIEKVNKPLAKAITILALRYPEPTHDILAHPNSHRLLDMLNTYLPHDTNKYRKKMFKAMFRILIAKYEHSPNWRNPIDFLVGELFKSDWKPFNPHRQMNYWKGG